MKRSVLKLLTLTIFAAAPQMFAAIETQLILDAGGGNNALITVETGNVVTVNCFGVCTLTANAAQDHKTLIVTGTLGSFDINTTGRGDLATVEPTLENLNQIQVKNTGGAGTLIAEFTDTDYTTLGTAFSLAASITNDVQINTSQTDFQAFVDASNGVPPPDGTLIGQFLNLTGNSQAVSGDFLNPAGSSGSLTTKTRIDFTGAGTVQANFTIANAVPEPASVVLFGTLMLGTGLTLRRRFGNQ